MVRADEWTGLDDIDEMVEKVANSRSLAAALSGLAMLEELAEDLEWNGMVNECAYLHQEGSRLVERLPKFGPAPEDDFGVLSWDDSHAIIGDWGDLELVRRDGSDTGEVI